MVMPDGFPRDLLEEILCRVPATSLQRIRYSCRLWNNICDTRRFTRKHFRKAPKQCLILMMNEFRVSSMSLNLFKNPSTRALSLPDPCFSSEQFEISKVSHWEGLLLCTNVYQTRIVVWNPCTGETRWIQTRQTGGTCALGSYHDKNSHGKSYKILCYNMGKFYPRPEFAIYESNSNSWRTIDTTLECHVEHSEFCVSLKGNTYWVVSAVKQKQLGVFLLAFDYTTETFRRLCLPYQCPSFEVVSLSVVREEKLSVLLQRDARSVTEI
ncbi:PREDICTED: probable F-box protein At5g47300 [Camelina sativa]|uniref:Probable F-box protein At5g47300 n=1 Tax=Camelina sativa TaxID=90675 RepID=A0ABM1RJF1_CAMSA|nr:PREDICTED: probable F-box protein At5g47300 [Camelina sativa]